MIEITKIKFEKVSALHIDTIFTWLAEPHVMASWDNSQAHKEDILNFVQGRKTPSSYADGKYSYWLASYNGEAYAMLMSIQETAYDDIGQEKLSRLSQTGHTYGLDFMIGNTNYLGKGLGSATLTSFLNFFRKHVDSKADTFLIDPDSSNPRAMHVYLKAGFQHVCDFVMGGDLSGSGKIHHLLVKSFELGVVDSMQQSTVRLSTSTDISALVSLSKTKRLSYEKIQPQFWKYAGPEAEQVQAAWFEELLTNDQFIMLTGENKGKINGFVIGKLVMAPQVYNPGGLTLEIDDFCVATDTLWDSLGASLLHEISNRAKARGAKQLYVVSGHHDEAKKQFLHSQNLSITSEWYVGGIV